VRRSLTTPPHGRGAAEGSAVGDGGGHRATRIPRRGALPLVSLVIVGRGDWQLAHSRVASIVDECVRLRVEIVLARPAASPDADMLARTFPAATVVEAAPDASLGELRAVGMREVSGDVVVFLNDSDALDTAWLAALTRQAERESPASSEVAASQLAGPR